VENFALSVSENIQYIFVFGKAAVYFKILYFCHIFLSQSFKIIS